MGEKIYKLPLDEKVDSDLWTWINSLPRNKKAEVVRHALRYYKSQLKEGETFIMPESTVPQNPVPTAKPAKRQKAGVNLIGITKTVDQ